ncbi:MAG: type IX secretion system membrane protein PorP/SprF [Flavobacteriales bacterium]|nr:type IX secretion system membrane protein PorP/SprF [Flavobacteriales bacterium]
MKYFSQIISTILLVTVSFKLSAQDPQFSQFYASPVFLNAALAGNTLMGRVSANYRTQWPKLGGPFNTYSFTFDYNIPKIQSGVGASVVRDRAGVGALTYTGVTLAYSYHLYVSRDINLKMGLKGTRAWRNLDQSRLVFGSQIIQQDLSIVPAIPLQQSSYWTFGTGFVVYNTEGYLGVSIDHFNRPNPSLIGQVVQLQPKFSVHGGYTFDLKKDVKNKTVTKVTPVINYKSQVKWNQLDLGAYYHYRVLLLGLWYRGIPLKRNPDKANPAGINQDAFVMMLGLQSEGLQVGYSYDATISRLRGGVGGAHEISLVYEFASRKRQLSRRFVVPCARF